MLGAVGATIGSGSACCWRWASGRCSRRSASTSPARRWSSQPRTFVAAYVVGIVVTMVAAYLPARRSARIAAGRRAARRRGDAGVGPALAARSSVGVLMSPGRRGADAGRADADVPKPGYWVGGGILAALLGVAVASPVIAKPFLAARWPRLYRRVFGTVGRLAGQNSLRNPRRTAATASALMIGLALVTTMSIARRVGEGQRRQDHRGELPRRPRGLQRDRAGVLDRARRRHREGAGRRRGGADPLRRQASVDGEARGPRRRRPRHTSAPCAPMVDRRSGWRPARRHRAWSTRSTRRTTARPSATRCAWQMPERARRASGRRHLRGATPVLWRPASPTLGTLLGRRLPAGGQLLS